MYLKYRWQPHGCNLARFDAQKLLKKLRGKSIMLTGDSLSRNQWRSLLCIIYTAIPNIKYKKTIQRDVSAFEFPEFGVKVMLQHNLFLVDIVKENVGIVLKLDSIEGGELWKQIDILIFNTFQWWNRRAPGQPWDYIEVGGRLYKDMDRMVAFEEALTTWAGWVESTIDPRRNRVFFPGISPSHYNGSEWNEPRAKACLGQKEPILGSTYHRIVPPAVAIVERVLSRIRKPVKLLNITHLSQLRKDGHPSIYGVSGPTGLDCTHWCVTGVPDTWNQILYNTIL